MYLAHIESALDKTGRDALEPLAEAFGTYHYAPAFISAWCAQRGLEPAALEESEKGKLRKLCDNVLQRLETLREALDASPLERALKMH